MKAATLVVVALSLFVACLSPVSAIFPNGRRSVEGAKNYREGLPVPTTVWFNQTVDHFNFYGPVSNFQQRLLVVNSSYRPGGPCFFYTGNEGPIDEFYNNTGFPFDNAAELGALIVFAEHRFFGESVPTWPKHEQNGLGLLSVEQALADYAAILEHLFDHHGRMPVIALGGSYGGILSAWFRIKYPHLVDMALAASAPILTVTQISAPPLFFKAVTDTFAAARPACPDAVRAGFAKLIQLSQTPAGLTSLTNTFRLCKPLTKDAVDHLIGWIRTGFVNMAMCDYPYPTNFLAPLPGFPVTVACDNITTAADPLTGLAAGVSLFYNGTSGSLSCFDIDAEYIECADATGCGTGPDSTAWDYIVCTELPYAPNANNVTDMFPPNDWSLEKLTAYCQKTYNVTPRPRWALTSFGGGNISKSASNIIFSNGLLDPWRSGGFLQTIAPSLPSVVIADGAHHLDLRPANAKDPQSVVVAREIEMDYIRAWLKNVNA